MCVKFYGRQQLSPRLTLSEGYRNSLGLCIFLALANQKSVKDKPIFLDDIVSSFDRNHRGMIANLISKELSERQVFLFTHDREWFAELKNRLQSSSWKFFKLKQWISPSIGIELVPSTYTFKEAEELLPDYIAASGNAVRAIMDTELPKAAEKLQIAMPYRYGHHNDTRTCVDFLNYLISQGKTKFEIKNQDWETYQEALESWKEAKELLVTWANRASHGKSISITEAQQLVDVCKNALTFFTCKHCKKKVWHLKGSKHMQCQCGLIKWKN